MARICGEIIYYLDMRESELYGWETKKSKIVVASIAEQILHGAKIPPVEIFQRENKIFELASPDGGHNRALAYFILRRSLPTKILDRPLEQPLTVNVRDIKIVDENEVEYFDRFCFRKEKDPKYLPYSELIELINKRLNI